MTVTDTYVQRRLQRNAVADSYQADVKRRLFPNVDIKVFNAVTREIDELVGDHSDFSFGNPLVYRTMDFRSMDPLYEKMAPFVNRLWDAAFSSEMAPESDDFGDPIAFIGRLHIMDEAFDGKTQEEYDQYMDARNNVVASFHRNVPHYMLPNIPKSLRHVVHQEIVSQARRSDDFMGMTDLYKQMKPYATNICDAIVDAMCDPSE